MNSTKRIATAPRWSDAETETGYLWFNAPIEVAGIIEAGVLLHGGCYRNQPDRHVTFEFLISNGRKNIPLARVDWRSLNGGHTNKIRTGCPVSGRRVSDSHLHSFELNWSEAEERMRGASLPQADDLPQHIQSFESLREFCGLTFKLSNIDIVPPPPWEYDMFRNG